MSTESAEVRELFDRIAACLPQAVPLNSAAFRSVGVKYANEADLISGDGAAYYGGRWNPPGVKAIYASLDPVTATRESYREFVRYGFSDEDIRPRVLAGLRVNARRLLDLTDAKIRRKLGFSLDDLRNEDWRAIQEAGEESWTQAIGRGAPAAGFEGLIAPSARHRGGTIVVLFPESLDSGSTVEPMAKDELPPHPSEWPKRHA